MNSVEATLACECGGSVIAHAADAGSTIKCRCGRSVQVPRLSQLRILVGRDAFVTNPAEAIRKAQRDGQSPAGKSCLICGASSPVLYRCDAICESTRLKGTVANDANGILSWLAFASMAWLVGFAFLRRSNPSELVIQGHDVGVTFDLPVCDACTSINGSPTRVSVAKDLMGRVPAYKELLAHYPELTLKIQRVAV